MERRVSQIAVKEALLWYHTQCGIQACGEWMDKERFTAVRDQTEGSTAPHTKLSEILSKTRVLPKRWEALHQESTRSSLTSSVCSSCLYEEKVTARWWDRRGSYK